MISGSSAIDESVCTGEVASYRENQLMTVFAGSINGQGSQVMRQEKDW